MGVSDLSSSAQVTVGVLTAGSVMGVLYYIFPSTWMAIIFAVVVLAGVLYGLFYWLTSASEKNKSGKLVKGVSKSLGRQFSESMARQLEDLQKRKGKSLVRIPWYLLVGEPGSGKTEAMRRSRLPGFRDEDDRGQGGTKTVDLWCSEQGVIFDTAGKLMYEKPEDEDDEDEIASAQKAADERSAAALKAVLQVLKVNRPNCPVNGLVLAVSAESLLEDNEARTKDKARTIADRLRTIRTTLGVRFPVYVLITKCDLIPGFREFFAYLGEADREDMQGQMLGWSDPEQFDAGAPAKIKADRCIEIVCNQINRLRLGLLRDPRPRSGPGGRRMDDVDELFAFPQRLQTLSSRLQRYLKQIFLDEDDDKPLFLRGIYFSSAIEEGAALDEEAAKILGLSLVELREEKGVSVTRENGLFLHDLFVKKIFKEKGLVTTASDPSKQMIFRRMLVNGALVLAALLVLLFAWLANSWLQQAIGREKPYWDTAATFWREEGGGIPKETWIIAESKPGRWSYNTKPTIRIGRRELSPLEFNKELAKFAARPISAGVFSPFFSLGETEKQRRRAWRVVFEGTVVQPLLEAARSKFRQLQTDHDPKEQDGETQAIIQLIGLEADAKNPLPSLSPERAEQFLFSLLRFVGQRPEADDHAKDLARIMATLYASDPSSAALDPKARWADERFAETPTDASGKKKALSDGFDRFLSHIGQSRQVAGDRGALMRDMTAAFRRYRDTEAELQKLAVAPVPVLDPAVADRLLADLDKTAADLQAGLAKATALGLDPTPGVFQLSSETAVAPPSAAALALVEQMEKAMRGEYDDIFAEWRQKLTDFREQTEKTEVGPVAPSATPAPTNVTEMEEFNARYLGTEDRHFATLQSRYRNCRFPPDGKLFKPSDNLLGTKWRQLEKFNLAVQAQTAALANVVVPPAPPRKKPAPVEGTGPDAPKPDADAEDEAANARQSDYVAWAGEVSAIRKFLIACAGPDAARLSRSAYCAQAKVALSAKLKFPLLQLNPADPAALLGGDLDEALALIKQIRDDLAAAEGDEDGNFTALKTLLDRIDKVRIALFEEDGQCRSAEAWLLPSSAYGANRELRMPPTDASAQPQTVKSAESVPQALGKFRPDEGFTLQYRDVYPPPPPPALLPGQPLGPLPQPTYGDWKTHATIAPWDALRMVHKGLVKMTVPGGKTYETTSGLRLRFVFARALPEMADWPAASDISRLP